MTDNRGQPRPDPGEKAKKSLVRQAPPHNLEAEQATLGGVFLRGSLFDELSEIVNAGDFYSPAHQIIFQALHALQAQAKPIDVLTVGEELVAKGRMDQIGGALYIAELATATISGANAIHHAHIVKDNSIRRNIIETGARLIEQGRDKGLSIPALIDGGTKSLASLADTGPGRATCGLAAEGLDEMMDDLFKRCETPGALAGLSLGYEAIDRIVGGIEPSDLDILAGRPGMGKTSAALCIALRQACPSAFPNTRGREPVPTAFYSLEMSRKQLLQRAVAVISHTSLFRLRNGYVDDPEIKRIYEAANYISKCPLYIDETPALSLSAFRASLRNLVRKAGVRHALIDYLQLMRPDGRFNSREQEVSTIAQTLKATAKELGIPVTALSQLSRKLEERKNKRPMLSDLRESGSIEQEADNVWFLYNEDFYRNQGRHVGSSTPSEFIIAKHRNGPTGACLLTFLCPSTAFEDMAKGEDR